MKKERTAKTKTGKVIKLYARLKTGRLVDCPGEAHSNLHIDNCMVCAPRWGQIEELAPIDFAVAKAAGLAIPYPEMSREEFDRAVKLEEAGEVEEVTVDEKRRGCTASFTCIVFKAKKLTKPHVAALERVIARHDSGAPLFSPSVATGTRDLSWAAKCALLNAGLIESFDWKAERAARGGTGATPPFIYYRPTASGLAFLKST